MRRWLKAIGEFKDGLEVLGICIIVLWFGASTCSYQYSPALGVTLDGRAAPTDSVQTWIVRVTIENQGVPVRIKSRTFQAYALESGDKAHDLNCQLGQTDPLAVGKVLVPQEKVTFECSVRAWDNAPCIRVGAHLEGMRQLVRIPIKEFDSYGSAIACRQGSRAIPESMNNPQP